MSLKRSVLNFNALVDGKKKKRKKKKKKKKKKVNFTSQDEIHLHQKLTDKY